MRFSTTWQSERFAIPIIGLNGPVQSFKTGRTEFAKPMDIVRLLATLAKLMKTLVRQHKWRFL
jgi:hypothetical protein